MLLRKDDPTDQNRMVLKFLGLGVRRWAGRSIFQRMSAIFQMAGLTPRQRQRPRWRRTCAAVAPGDLTAFVVAALTGPLLFINHATDHFANTMFPVKMLLILLAGINMLVFELITVRGASDWDVKPVPPLPARLAGALSIACWFLVIVFGRFTGFTMPQV